MSWVEFPRDRFWDGDLYAGVYWGYTLRNTIEVVKEGLSRRRYSCNRSLSWFHKDLLSWVGPEEFIKLGNIPFFGQRQFLERLILEPSVADSPSIKEMRVWILESEMGGGSLSRDQHPLQSTLGLYSISICIL